MNKHTMILFTRFGMGDAPVDLPQKLAGTFLTLLDQHAHGNSDGLPGVLAFYGEGVKLACEGSPVLDQLRALETRGAHLILCQTCLNYFGLREAVRVGIVGGMGDIMAALDLAQKVISL